jgi:hypothetical protein
MFTGIGAVVHGIILCVADPGFHFVSDVEGKRTFCLEAWRARDKALAWFSKGITGDEDAKLTFTPSLNKHMRDELHR